MQAKFREGLARLPPDSKKAIKEWVEMWLGRLA